MQPSERELLKADIHEYLRRYERKELLRFVAVGSVDDGKSTLIGRLLHDTEMVYDDQIAAVQAASSMPDGEMDFSLFTDGLAAEREQGITIDVAYRYFATEKRKFIIADTPGHVQYTRNMVTGASTANVAIILVDARLGVLQQSRRHAYIASMLGIPHLLVAVNKMDLVGFDPQVFERIRDSFRDFSKNLRFKDVTFIPISALKGVHVARRTRSSQEGQGAAQPPGANIDTAAAWYEGPTVLEYLETVPISLDRNFDDLRYPVQYVVRPDLNYRGFAGQIASGVLRTGDEVVALPSGRRSRVRSIDTMEGALEEAFTPMSVCLRLEDEIDVSRGDILCRPDNLPRVGRKFDAHLVWMSEKGLDPQKSYVLKHTTQAVRCEFGQVHWKMDMDTLEEQPAEALELNDIGKVTIRCHRALYLDAYERNRATGAFVIVDSLSNNTVAAGMVLEQNASRTQTMAEALQELRSGSGLQPTTQVSPAERRERMGQSGATVWLTGLPGSGRWSLAYALERRLFDLGRTATVIVPTDEDLRSIISAAKAATRAGLIAVVAFPAYERADRERARNRIGKERFLQVHVNTREELCRERRPDADFEGFEAPTHPEVTVALDSVPLEDAVGYVIDALSRHPLK